MTIKCLSLLFLVITLSCAKVNHVADYQVSAYQINDSINSDNVDEINELIKPYKTKLDAEMNVVIGESATRLNKAFPESTLGNFVADVLYRKAEEYYEGKVDFALINYYSIGIQEVQKGNITKAQVYELMPFENHLVIMKVDQYVVLQLFENIAKKGGWPISKQVKFKIENDIPIDISINGQPLKGGYIYHIAVSDYLANGGDSCSFFKGEDRDNVDVLIRNMIMQGILDQYEKGVAITAALDGRIKLKE